MWIRSRYRISSITERRKRIRWVRCAKRVFWMENSTIRSSRGSMWSRGKNSTITRHWRRRSKSWGPEHNQLKYKWAKTFPFIVQAPPTSRSVIRWIAPTILFFYQIRAKPSLLWVDGISHSVGPLLFSSAPTRVLSLRIKTKLSWLTMHSDKQSVHGL